MERALIVVDVQNDFLPGGALAVPRGDEIIPVINDIMQDYNLVVFSKDWHPENHISFCTRHGVAPFTKVADGYGGEMMVWPEHCIQGTYGARLSNKLKAPLAQSVIAVKGTGAEEGYSAGYAYVSGTDHDYLSGFLRHCGVESLDICGLATDYCVDATARQFVDNWDFKVRVLLNACRGVSEGTVRQVIKDMKKAGVVICDGV